MKPSVCHELIEALGRAETVEEIHRIGCTICEQFDFEHFLYATSVPVSFVAPPIFFISGYPKEWRDHYNEQGFTRIDPTVGHTVRHVTPLSWDAIRAMEQTDPAVRRFMQESREFRLNSGITLPLHGPQGEVAMLNFASAEQQERATGRIRLAMPQLHLLTAYFHEAVRRVIEVVEVGPAKSRLSEREQQCLLWAAEGKTSWETSLILGIAERTVIFHLQNACDKLQVANRQHAVARAVAMGLLTPQYG